MQPVLWHAIFSHSTCRLHVQCRLPGLEFTLGWFGSESGCLADAAVPWAICRVVYFGCAGWAHGSNYWLKPTSRLLLDGTAAGL